MAGVAIKVDHVRKSFKLPHEKQSSIKGLFVNVFRPKRSFERQEVLKDISIEIKEGEFFGIVGRNGSGKSTLLKLLAGIYSPDKGTIHINGKLIPFIELGVGFSPELTGRDNVFLNGSLLGFSRKEMEAMYDEIVAFAELERFMDQKLKNYSSGMQVRLAFSIAIRAKGDILLLDEVLAVGDAIFQKKCYDYFKQLKKEKKTVIFVSHDAGALQEYCDRGILIDKSELIYEGKIEKVISRYLRILTNQEEQEVEVTEKSKFHQHTGSGAITVEQVNIKSGANEEPRIMFEDKDKMLHIQAIYKVNKNVEEPIYGITIFDAAGQRIFVTNNMWVQKKAPAVKTGQTINVTWDVPNIFNSGTYKITPAVAGSRGSEMFDQVDDMLTFKIRKRVISNAIVNVDHQIVIKEFKAAQETK